jgi:hypothetical protein
MQEELTATFSSCIIFFMAVETGSSTVSEDPTGGGAELIMRDVSRYWSDLPPLSIMNSWGPQRGDAQADTTTRGQTTVAPATTREHWSEYMGRRYARVLAVMVDHALTPVPVFLENTLYEAYSAQTATPQEPIAARA